MADGKGTALARRTRPAFKVVSRGNKVNLALPFSMIRAEETVKMRARDWISLAGLGISVIGFSVVIRQLIRIADASEADQASHRVNREEADSLADPSSPEVEGGLAEKVL